MRATIFFLVVFLCGAVHCADDSVSITEIKDKLQTIVDNARTIVDEVFSAAFQPVYEALAKALVVVEELIEEIKSALGNSSSLWDTLPISSLIVELENSLTSLIDLLDNVASRLVSAATSLLDSLLSTIFVTLDKIETALTGSTSDCSNDVYSTLLSLVNTLEDEFNSCISGLEQSLLEVIDLTTTTMEELLRNLQDAIVYIPSCSIITVITCLTPGLGGFVIAAVNAVLTVVTSLFAILEGLNDVVSAYISCTNIQKDILIAGAEGALEDLKTCISA